MEGQGYDGIRKKSRISNVGFTMHVKIRAFVPTLHTMFLRKRAFMCIYSSSGEDCVEVVGASLLPTHKVHMRKCFGVYPSGRPITFSAGGWRYFKKYTFAHSRVRKEEDLTTNHSCA